MEIITKPLVTMSNGLLMDHSRNTIGMDLVVIKNKLKLPLLLDNAMGHTIFWLNAWNAIIVEWACIPHVQLHFTCKVFAKLKGFAISFM
jgi:hypothetical protein